MISFISSLEIIDVVKPDPNIFLWITASFVDSATVNPNGIKTYLANSLSIFLIKGNPVFSNRPKSLPENPPDCSILFSWVFDNFTLADKPLAKALRSFETYALVNKNLWGKPFSSLELPTTFDKIFKVTSVQLFIPHFKR